MQSLSRLLKNAKNVTVANQNLCKSIAKPKRINGEWLCDAYPDISLITSQSEKLVDSLVKRIQVKNRPMAEGLVAQLAESLNQYDSSTERLQYQRELYDKYDEKSGNALEFYELKVEVTEAKRRLEKAYDELLKLYGAFPNVIAENLPNNAQRSLPNLQNISVPSLTFDDSAPAHDCRTYLTGEKALRELELTDFAAEYLEQCEFEPVTFPSFLRCEVVEQSGVKNGVESDVYTLLTKPEVHALGDTTPLDERKPKVEDNFVYQARGLSELALMSFFIRCDLEKRHPVRIYSIGNQYRTVYGGEPPQSRVALFMTASKDAVDAVSEFSSGVALMENFWKTLNVDVTKLAVEPHLLEQHEACAREFVMNCKNGSKSRLVLSKMSLSYDYVSRRIMTYSSRQDSQRNHKYSHFTTGKLIDINLLLEHL